MLFQETRPSPSCSWGMENGISYSYGILKDHCCIRNYNQLACAQDGWNAKVHQMCQWAWLRRENLDMNFNSSTYCPMHNRQRGDYIKWYYETMKNKPIPESLKLTISEDVGEINQSMLGSTVEHSAGTCTNGNISNNQNNGICVICSTAIYAYSNNNVISSCNHTFHKDCVLTWINKKVYYWNRLST